MSRRTNFPAALLCIAFVCALLPTRSSAASGTVNVFYAGSLVNLNENLVGKAFAAGTGYTYEGKAAGSLAIAAQIKSKIAMPDVVELADPGVDSLLMGDANGSYVSWYLTYARSTLVVGFDPKGRFAQRFRQVQAHHLAWYKALLQRGLRIGRTDPNLDPKGYRALFMAQLAEKVYHLNHFKRRIFGADDNPSQIFPEEVLVARILTGQLDAGIFYLSEVRDLGIPYITLPATINLGSVRYAKLYATQHFTTAAGKTIAGAPIEYTITIPSTVRNAVGAEAFVRFVLSKRIRDISAAHGLLRTQLRLSGKRADVPLSLQRFIGMK